MVDSAFSENEQALEGKGIQNSNRWQANLVFIRIEWRTNTVWHVTYAVSMFRPYKITMTCIFSGSDVGKNIFLGKEFSVCLWNCFFCEERIFIAYSWSVLKCCEIFSLFLRKYHYTISCIFTNILYWTALPTKIVQEQTGCASVILRSSPKKDDAHVW